MKPSLRQALWITAAAVLTGAATLGALRVVRSMRRGRGAVFSLAPPAARPAAAVSFDVLARSAEARYAGPSADQAWESLRRCPGPPPISEGPRRVVATLSEEGRPVARRSLHLPAGGAAEFPLVIPASATLSFIVGARAEAAGVLDAAVEIQLPGKPAEALDLFTEDFPGRSARRESAWRRVEMDLSPWAGRSAVLRWRVSFRGVDGSTASAHAFWAAPALWTPVLEEAAKRVPFHRKEDRAARNAVWVVFETFSLPSFNGSSLEDFPGVGLLAREGVEFQQTYGNHPSAEEGLRRLLTGRGPDEATSGPRPFSPPGVRAFPALAREGGRRTLLFGAPGEDPSAWVGVGFDEVRGAPRAGAGGEQALREAAQWMTENGGRGPYLLMVFVRAPTPREDPSPRCWLRAARLSPSFLFRGRRWRALAQTIQSDGALRRLWTQKLHLGDEDRTLFAVASLRGASFRPEPLRRLDDGRLIHRPLPEPGLGLREEEVRALWVLRHPSLTPGRKVTASAQLLDAAPTALELMGLPVPPEMEGRSFARPVERSDAAEEGKRFLIDGPGGAALVLDGHFKYVRRGPAREVSADGARARTDFEPEELYNLWEDPAERRNLARRQRDLLARARQAINERRPERVVTRLVFQGWQDAPLQGVVRCPGGDLWNVSLSTGDLVRSGSSQVSFTVSAPEASFSFETWPPPAHFTFSLRSRGRSVPVDAFVISRLGLPLVDVESWNEWFDRNKFKWMDGLPAVGPPGAAPRVYLGREPVREEAP